jgi:hypothetical protein
MTQIADYLTWPLPAEFWRWGTPIIGSVALESAGAPRPYRLPS